MKDDYRGYRCPKCKKILRLGESYCCLFTNYTYYRISIPNTLCGDCRVFILDVVFVKQIIRETLNRSKELYGDRMFGNRKKEIARRTKIVFENLYLPEIPYWRDRLGYIISRQRIRIINPE